MNLLVLFACVSTLFTLATADATHISPSIVHERRMDVPLGWKRVHKISSSSVLLLSVGLKQSNLENLERMLHDVSLPQSPNYGKHWSPTRIAETFAPSSKTIAIVRNWLTTSGFDASRLKLTASRIWIEVNVTVGEAEGLLKTTYHLYEHESGKKHIACNAYHLPEHVAPHIDLVTPSIHFDAILGKRNPVSTQPAKKIGSPGVGIHPKTTGTISNLFTQLEHCDEQVTPICLRALYGLIYQPLAAKKNTFGIVEYTPQAYVQSDLDMFARNFSKDLVGKSPKLVSIDGGVVQTTRQGFDYNGESNLDLQYGMNLVNAFGSAQDVILYQVGDLLQGASFNNLLDALDGSYCNFEGGDDPSQDGIYPDGLPGGYTGSTDCGTTKPAHVISTSYGYNEADLSPFYTARQCAEYGKLGLMGVSVVYSSGDNGVAGNGALCLNKDGSQTEEGSIFNPGFPSGCPFVTSVGATQINEGAKVTDPESACERVIVSGGGFSNYFAMPDYQKKAVGKYYQNHKPNYSADIWNSTEKSRGFPDVSANGANYVVAVNGQFSLVYGTSAAAPVFAAILTMINDARLALGKSSVGFINPVIYSDAFAGAFNDITSGGNPGCGTSGFSAVPGWDPVTGLGTPSFPKLLARWLLLP